MTTKRNEMSKKESSKNILKNFIPHKPIEKLFEIYLNKIQPLIQIYNLYFP